MRLHWASSGRVSTLRLRRVLGAGPGQPAALRAEDAGLSPGDRIRLVEVRGRADTIEWFRGYVAQERLVVQGEGRGDACEVVAYGPEILMQGKAVTGQWHATPAVDEAMLSGQCPADQRVGGQTFRSHLPVVFNEHGRANASPATLRGQDAAWHLDGDAEAATARGRTFDSPGRRAVGEDFTYEADFWSAAAAAQSLVETVDDYEVIAPASLGDLPAELSENALGEVSVEGLNLLEALRAVLVPAGYGFAVEPWAGEDGRHALRVFALHGRPDGSRVRTPYMAPVDGAALTVADAQAQRAEVQRIEFLRDNHNVANDVTVIGDQKRSQAILTFRPGGGKLKPAWDTDAFDLEIWASEGVVDPMQWGPDGPDCGDTTSFDDQYTYGGHDAAAARHAFRSFAWNEDGALGSVIETPADLSEFGVGDEGGNYVRRPRPVGPTFVLDDAATRVRTLPAFVQLGVDGDGWSWMQIPAVIWPDRAGFTIPVNPLWDWYPYAGQYGRNTLSGVSGATLFDQYGKWNYLTLLLNTLTGGGEAALALRLVGSIECDQAVQGRAARQVTSSWPLTAAKIVRAEHRFRWRQVPQEADPWRLADSRYDLCDDTDAAGDLATTVRDVLEDEVAHGSIVLRCLSRGYGPGDVVPRTGGRVIDLTVRGGTGDVAPVVVAVNWDFQDGVNKTELLLDTSLLGIVK
jgi:hypothetical protein